jgi:hypothetical protein
MRGLCAERFDEIAKADFGTAATIACSGGFDAVVERRQYSAANMMVITRLVRLGSWPWPDRLVMVRS